MLQSPRTTVVACALFALTGSMASAEEIASVDTEALASQAACIADWDGDGDVDMDDVAAYEADYYAGNPSADVNQDATVNFFDYAYFLSRWANGC